MLLTSCTPFERVRLACLAVIAAATPLRAQSVSKPDLPRDLSSALRSAVLEERLDAVWHSQPPGSGAGDGWQAPNRRLSMRTHFGERGIRVRPFAGGDWRWSATCTGIGREGAMRPLAEASPDARANTVVYERRDSLEWYVNTDDGLEQGFTLVSRPAPETRGLLAIELALDTDLAGEPCADSRGALFRDGCGEIVVTYTGLTAWDAKGRDLDARVALRGTTLTLLVDDAAAEYPLVVDPLIATSEVKILPPAPTQYLSFGYDVALDGDTAAIGTGSSLYIFVRSGSAWVQQAFFNVWSTDVKLEGDTLVIGSAFSGPYGNVFVYRRSGSVWQHFDTIVNPNAHPGSKPEEFGAEVDISGSRIAVLNTDDANNGGRPVLVYRYSTFLGEYRGEAWIGGSNGLGLVLRGDELIFASAGKLVHYRFDPAVPGWGFVSEILGPTAGIFSLDLAGEDVLVAGVPLDDTQGTDAGAVHVLERFAGQWKETAKLFSDSPAAVNYFGREVAVHEGTLFASDRIDSPGADAGAVQVIARNDGWRSMGAFAGSDTVAGDYFGFGLDAGASSTAGDVRVLAGAPFANTGAQSSGAAYFFELAHQDAQVYCTSKLNSQGCVPRIAFTGTPSASGSAPFTVSALQVINLKNGVFLYGTSGRAALPFQGGIMCVQLPKRLTGIHNSGGNPAGIDCSGAFSLDFNVRIRSGVDPNLAPGALVDGQFWYRDPADSIGIGLTEAIEFVVQP